MNTVVVYKLPVMDTIKNAWQKVHGVKAYYWEAFAVIILTAIVFAVTIALCKTPAPIIAGILQVIRSIVFYLFGVGIIYLGIRRAYDLPITFDMAFKSLKANFALKLIGLYIAQILIYLIPIIIFFIVPAAFFPQAGNVAKLFIALVYLIGILVCIFIGVRLTLSKGYVIFQETGPIAAISLSFSATKSNVWNLICIFILQALIFIVSVIPLGIGLIWSLPFLSIIGGEIYKYLNQNVKPAAISTP